MLDVKNINTFSQKAYLVIDCETTGLTVNDKIIELAFIRLDKNGNYQASFCCLINPNIEIANTDIHNIDNNTVENALEFTEIESLIYLFLNQALIVSHNAEFDVNFLFKELDSINKSEKIINSLSYTKNIQYFCTMKKASFLVKDFYNYNPSLEKLANYFNIENTCPHAAWGDAKVCSLILKQYIKNNIFNLNQVNNFSKELNKELNNKIDKNIDNEANEIDEEDNNKTNTESNKDINISLNINNKTELNNYLNEMKDKLTDRI